MPWTVALWWVRVAANQTNIRRSRWREDLVDDLDITVDQLTEPFTLESLYPEVEYFDPALNRVVSTHVVLPHQQKIHDCISMNGETAKFVLHSGGFGSGKTLAMAVEMVRLVRQYPGIKIVIVTAWDHFIETFIMPTLVKVLPWEDPLILKYNARERLYTFVNGAQIWLKAFDDPERIRGWEAHVIWMEEAAEVGGNSNEKGFMIFQALLGRMRAPGDYPSRMYVSMNPKGHNWVWKVFIKDNPHGDIGQRTRIEHPLYPEGFEFCEYEKQQPNGDILYSIASGTAANRFLPSGYLETMLDQFADNPDVQKRLVEGSFAPINTLVYDGWIYDPAVHVITWGQFLSAWEIPQIPYWWPVIVGIDPAGMKSPWAVEYYVVTPEGDVVCFDEIYLKEMTYGPMIEMIQERAESYQKVRYFVDPISSRQRSGFNATTLQLEFEKYGMNIEMPRGYGTWNGIAHVWDFLRRDHSRPSMYHEDTLDEATNKWKIGRARLHYIKDACRANLKEKEVYRLDSRRQRPPQQYEEGLTPYMEEKVLGRDDHAQTAEMFALLGYFPFDPKNARFGPDDPPDPALWYPAKKARPF